MRTVDEGRGDPTGQRVLVTGGSGFVGRSVVAEFQRRGVDVVVADRDPFPGAGVAWVPGDLTDPAVRDRAVTADLDGIVHLAAITSVLRSAEQPQETFQNNVEMTQGLLELARTRGVAPFVLASTNAVVGNVGTSTITEHSPLHPLTPYGATKAACEMLLSGYAGAYGMVTCALRFTNIYGPGMAAKDSFVPRLMRAALSGGGVQVYGDGKQSRDLVHVEDVATTLVNAWQRRFGGTAIVGAATSVTVLDLIEAARTATGAPLPVEHVPAKTGEMPAVIVDTAKACAELDHRPKYELADGLRTVWDDFRAAAGLAVPTGPLTGAAAPAR
ncbi:MAG TPA: NAD(P)-dependent oxidoreductase [Pseudonocardiaceae bacterium]|nr:NAD(P)-dependent oxidoreductase [Pseudonocardiaceae bacterium]